MKSGEFFETNFDTMYHLLLPVVFSVIITHYFLKSQREQRDAWGSFRWKWSMGRFMFLFCSMFVLVWGFFFLWGSELRC